MLLSVIFPLVLMIPVNGNDVTRDFFGDIFRMRDCHNGSRCDNGGRRAALQVPGRPCYCQCSPTHLAYREDKQQCVKDIKECYMSVFYRPFTVEAIPLVYLPTSGQLVHPDAHLSLSMRRNFEGGLAKCRVTVSQYLTREGWRTLAKADGAGGSVFGLFTDANKTYLQFLGNSHDRRLLQQHMALVRLLCIIPQYPAFETCVAIRIGWVPGIENLEDIAEPSNKANMMVVGLSLGVLALVYIFAVLVYLKIRRQMIAKKKAAIDHEAKLQGLNDESEKTASLHRMETSNRLELYHKASLGRQKHGKKGFRNGCDPWNQLLPIVETYNRTWTDRMGQHSSEFRAQDFKLQPEYFEPEFMASPPHEVLEYLERLQNSITFARHRMRSCYRYQPTLNGIPEDDYFYQELENKDAHNKEIRTTPDGGSASSVDSLKDSSDQKNDIQKRELPKIPPRKPKRKSMSSQNGSSPESAHSSDHEQKEIQKAMNTLNDTLEALEYDIFKQEMLNQASDTENANLSCQNSTSIDFDEFETSSCSSMSAITILGRDAKRQSDISKCSQYFEKNHSEEFSTFSNSTYSLGGLFHDGNKISSPHASEISNHSSRCPSRAESGSQEERIQSPKLEMQILNMQEYLDEDNTNANGNEKENMFNSVQRKSNLDGENNPSSYTKDDQNLENVGDISALPGGPPLRKSPSNESMTTIATDMTTDSLDSRCPSPNRPSPTPSLMEMWISKLVPTSVPYSKTRRKSKKKLVLPEDEVESWEHVCQKYKDSCPMHDLNDSEPNLIDKLAHYGSKTMADCNVAGYFQSLKQDVLKEHLKVWLSSNNQSKRNKRGISIKYSNECSHTKPLVNGQETNLVDENGMHLSCKPSSRCSSVEPLRNIQHKTQEGNIIYDSLESSSAEMSKANGSIYFGEMKEVTENTILT